MSSSSSTNNNLIDEIFRRAVAGYVVGSGQRGNDVIVSAKVEGSPAQLLWDFLTNETSEAEQDILNTAPISAWNNDVLRPILLDYYGEDKRSDFMEWWHRTFTRSIRKNVQKANEDEANEDAKTAAPRAPAPALAPSNNTDDSVDDEDEEAVASGDEASEYSYYDEDEELVKEGKDNEPEEERDEETEEALSQFAGEDEATVTNRAWTKIVTLVNRRMYRLTDDQGRSAVIPIRISSDNKGQLAALPALLQLIFQDASSMRHWISWAHFSFLQKADFPQETKKDFFRGCNLSNRIIQLYLEMKSKAMVAVGPGDDLNCLPVGESVQVVMADQGLTVPQQGSCDALDLMNLLKDYLLQLSDNVHLLGLGFLVNHHKCPGEFQTADDVDTPYFIVDVQGGECNLASSIYRQLYQKAGHCTKCNDEKLDSWRVKKGKSIMIFLKRMDGQSTIEITDVMSTFISVDGSNMAVRLRAVLCKSDSQGFETYVRMNPTTFVSTKPMSKTEAMQQANSGKLTKNVNDMLALAKTHSLGLLYVVDPEEKPPSIHCAAQHYNTWTSMLDKLDKLDELDSKFSCVKTSLSLDNLWRQPDTAAIQDAVAAALAIEQSFIDHQQPATGIPHPVHGASIDATTESDRVNDQLTTVVSQDNPSEDGVIDLGIMIDGGIIEYCTLSGTTVDGNAIGPKAIHCRLSSSFYEVLDGFIQLCNGPIPITVTSKAGAIVGHLQIGDTENNRYRVVFEKQHIAPGMVALVESLPSKK